MLMLPGTVVNYYGQEFGMPMALIRLDQSRDECIQRDRIRTPMQLDSTFNAGRELKHAV